MRAPGSHSPLTSILMSPQGSSPCPFLPFLPPQTPLLLYCVTVPQQVASSVLPIYTSSLSQD